MTYDKRFWQAIMALTLVLGGVWIWAFRVPDSSAGDHSVAPQKGFLAPDFVLSTLDGGRMRLSDLRGRPVLVNFWASWCGPCRAEMPHIQAAHEAHTGEGLIVVGVNQMESQATVAQFVNEFGLTFPVPLDRDGDVSDDYRARALPTSFFVDADGVIRDVVIGPMTSGLIESKLEAILPGGE